MDNDKSLSNSHNKVFPDFKLKVYSYNHVPQTKNDIRNYQQICSALSSMRFNDEIVFVQFWACINFEDALVLSTRGQPFGLSMYTNEIWAYRVACLDQNSYVDYIERLYIGLPGFVFLTQSPEWNQDVSKDDDKVYPLGQDIAKYSNIQGSLFMPVIEGDGCIGVLEFVITNFKDNVSKEIDEVCRALEEVGLKSFITLGDNSPFVESRNPPKGCRNSKSCKITCKDITKLFGLPKAVATKICGISSKSTFTKVHKGYGIRKWPCIRNGILKSSAHNALVEHGRASHTSSHETRMIKHLNSLLMQDNDDISYEGRILEENMHDLISNDGKRVREQIDEGDNLILLELFQPKNKRSRN